MPRKSKSKGGGVKKWVIYLYLRVIRFEFDRLAGKRVWQHLTLWKYEGKLTNGTNEELVVKNEDRTSGNDNASWKSPLEILSTRSDTLTLLLLSGRTNYSVNKRTYHWFQTLNTMNPFLNVQPSPLLTNLTTALTSPGTSQLFC